MIPFSGSQRKAPLQDKCFSDVTDTRFLRISCLNEPLHNYYMGDHCLGLAVVEVQPLRIIVSVAPVRPFTARVSRETVYQYLRHPKLE